VVAVTEASQCPAQQVSGLVVVEVGDAFDDGRGAAADLRGVFAG